MHTRRDCSARYAPRLIRFGAVQVQWRGSSNVGFSEPFGRSAASADALDRGSYPGFLFNLFCLKLFIFWRAALGPGHQMFGAINCSGGSTDSSNRFHLSPCVRCTRDHCLLRSHCDGFCRRLGRSRRLLCRRRAV